MDTEDLSVDIDSINGSWRLTSKAGSGDYVKRGSRRTSGPCNAYYALEAADGDSGNNTTFILNKRL
ncbi:hypothetical protein PsorP6_016487 [Peronosclerospora sorghi]|uniref:Uncharacterized protein n=1 Tax=Peronosclerospora sorghi TaxID=230839 RepID=A0ACC0VIX7_9STRA|nr:hypothetical protein PsorP6_016487 [Peronosclerospora sorghi]